MVTQKKSILIGLRWTSTAVLSACLAFWSWFVLATAFSEGAAAILPAAAFLGAFAVLLLTGVLRPRIGGLIALLAAGFAVWFRGLVSRSGFSTRAWPGCSSRCRSQSPGSAS